MIFLMVIVGLAILVLIHEFGHFLVAKLLGMKVDEFGIGFPPRLFKKEMGGTVYSVNALPFGGFVRLYGEDEAAAGFAGGEKEKGFNNEPAWKKSLVLLAGVFMNVILGSLLLSLVFMTGMPKHLVIQDVAPGSPAFAAGLKSGDILKGVSANGATLADPISSDDFTKLVKGDGANDLTLDIERDGGLLQVNLTPRINPPEGQGPLGVEITEVGFEAQPFFRSLGAGISETWTVGVMVVQGLGAFIGQLFVSPGAVGNVTGPVGIVFLAAQATKLGFVYFLQLLALISVNLAVLNLLPFPALDGGRFLFVILEKAFRRQIPRKFQLWVNGAGFAILILLMVFITIKDIGRFF